MYHRVCPPDRDRDEEEREREEEIRTKITEQEHTFVFKGHRDHVALTIVGKIRSHPQNFPPKFNQPIRGVNKGNKERSKPTMKGKGRFIKFCVCLCACVVAYMQRRRRRRRERFGERNSCEIVFMRRDRIQGKAY